MKFASTIALSGAALAMAAKPQATASYTEAALADQVTDLPGLTQPINFNHFAGYLNIPGGSATTMKHVHYQLVEASDVDPATAPITFWTNGGPGCSGYLGLLTEQGPFRPDGEGNVAINPYAWNRLTNMVFIEQPAGVGFSYADDKSDYRTNDDIASADFYATVQQFMTRFPQYANNDVYVSSESYGGHYAPRFTDYLVEANKSNKGPKINIRGFAVGNPFNDWNAGTPTMLQTLHGHQLVSEQDWSKYQTKCLDSTDPKAAMSEECEMLELKLTMEIGNLNVYALDYPVCTSTNQQGRWLLKQVLPERLHANILGAYEPCEDNYATSYLNTPSVQAALHVNQSLGIEWEECSTTVKYDFANEFLSMSKYYTKLVNDGMKILVYSGNDDSVCGTIGTQSWIYDLGFRVSSSWKAWMLDGQTAGWVTKFDTSKAGGKLAFQVVHKAGHEVPTYVPEAAFDLFRTYLDESVF